MDSRYFTIEMDGHRVLVDQAKQCVTLLETAGAAASCSRIQVAAGSLQGIFSLLETFNGTKNA